MTVQFTKVLVVCLAYHLVTTLGERHDIIWECQACNFTSIINENASIGSEVFALPMNVSGRYKDISITRGDMNEVFAVNTSGVVRVSKLIDYDLMSSYDLSISVTSLDGIMANATLRVEITDIIDWPPVFNESCYINSGSGTKQSDALLYELYGNYGKGRKPVEELILFKDKENFKNSFEVDSYNSDCDAFLYFGTHDGSLTLENMNAIQFLCDFETGVTAEAFSSKDSALIGNPYVNAQWLIDYDVIVVLRLHHMVGGTDSGACEILVNELNVLNVGIDFVPQGCPSGKYGFKCEDDCVCQNGASCHPFNGACRCMSGWTGPACDIAVKELVLPKVTHVVYGEILNLVCYHYNMRIKNAKRGVRWYRNGTYIDYEHDVYPRPMMRIHNSNEGYSSLTITGVVDSDAAVYSCEVTDMTGQTRRTSGQVVFDGCLANKWGETCEEVCNCQNEALCIRSDGCVCRAGWNGTTCSQDIQAPTIKGCPGDIVLSPDKKHSNFTVTWKEPIITDNSDQLSVTSNANPGDRFGYGKHTVSYEAIDGGGNTAICQFEVDVKKPGGLPKPVIGGLSGLAFLLCLLCVVGPYLGYKYRHEIQTIIADKLHPYEDDDGRRFDAFISVKGDTPDEVFAYRTLLPTLEKKYGFRLCLHHRDFVIGEAIVENIITSIKDSRRTILILSPAFVESEWCDYEVLMAHKEMIGLKQKLIPLMFEDITGLENIRPSLQSILNTITYISWPGEGDIKEKEVDKFWKRLVKAMPRKRKQSPPDVELPDGELPAARLGDKLPNSQSTFIGRISTHVRNLSKRLKRNNGRYTRCRTVSDVSADFDNTALIQNYSEVIV